MRIPAPEIGSVFRSAKCSSVAKSWALFTLGVPFMLHEMALFNNYNSIYLLDINSLFIYLELLFTGNVIHPFNVQCFRFQLFIFSIFSLEYLIYCLHVFWLVAVCGSVLVFSFFLQFQSLSIRSVRRGGVVAAFCTSCSGVGPCL